ncbi:hypothetical protein EfmAA290_05680 [Enterococcus faecium]|nr:hypothetical protein EfmAA290_05680 [Enterococcus faecium]
MLLTCRTKSQFLNGNGFEILVKQGDLVKAGDLLIRFDIEAIRAAGYSVITPVVKNYKI